jgi:hypothetical protein
VLHHLAAYSRLDSAPSQTCSRLPLVELMHDGIDFGVDSAAGSLWRVACAWV